MSAPHPDQARWAPRHRGWKLAHHLLPAIIMAAFLVALGVWALVLGSLVFGIPLLAFAVGTAVSVGREFRLDPDPVEPDLHPVVTSSGLRAATSFALRPNSQVFAAATVGLGVVGLVAALAAVGRFLLLHTGLERWWTIAGALALGAVGFLILREGLRLLRIASADQPPGVYLTRSRVVVFGPLGLREMYWRDMESIGAANPRGRAPLGRRGPALVVLRGRAAPGDGTGPAAPTRILIEIQFVLADPNVLLAALQHYLDHAGDRPELGTDAALGRLLPGG